MDAPTLNDFLNRRVVLDTQGPLLYIGQLTAWDDRGYWLEDADVHDQREGHASKEEYTNTAHELEQTGARHINRRRVFIERRAIVSISALDDVVTDGLADDQGPWVA
jgi:small nuclear ribonucleoprotein (snRNP)-like protein